MGAAGPGQNRISRTDFEFFAVDRHHAAAAEHVVNLVFVLHVIPDCRARLERPLAEDQLELRRLAEKRVADRLTSAVVSARFVLRDLFIALEHKSAWLGRFFLLAR